MANPIPIPTNLCGFATALTTGEEITPGQLCADGFDAISVEAIAPGGQRSEIVSEELA